jgi:signal-transduction protein with cAMP-binding, CBS, and nucleotidyltransferase domain
VYIFFARSQGGSVANAVKALSRMSHGRSRRLLVVKGGCLLGIITLKDMQDFFSLKVELEEARLQRRSPERDELREKNSIGKGRICFQNRRVGVTAQRH